MKINDVLLNLICYTIKIVKIKVLLLPMTNVGMLDCQRPEHYRPVEIKVRVSVDEFVGESFGSRLRLPPDAPVGAGGSLCGGRLCLHPAHWIQATSPSWTIQENQTSPLFSHQPPRNHTCKGVGGGGGRIFSALVKCWRSACLSQSSYHGWPGTEPLRSVSYSLPK